MQGLSLNTGPVVENGRYLWVTSLGVKVHQYLRTGRLAGIRIHISQTCILSDRGYMYVDIYICIRVYIYVYLYIHVQVYLYLSVCWLVLVLMSSSVLQTGVWCLVSSRVLVSRVWCL